MINIVINELKLIKRDRIFQIVVPVFLLLVIFLVSPYSRPGNIFGEDSFLSVSQSSLTIFLFPLICFLLGNGLRRDKVLSMNELIATKPFPLVGYTLGKTLGGLLACLSFVLLPAFLVLMCEKLYFDIEGATAFLFVKLFYSIVIQLLPLIFAYVVWSILIGSIIKDRVLFFGAVLILWVLTFRLLTNNYLFLSSFGGIGFMLLYFWIKLDFSRLASFSIGSYLKTITARLRKPLIIFGFLLFLVLLYFYMGTRVAHNIILATFEVAFPLAMAVSVAGILQRERDERIMETILAKPVPIRKLISKRIFIIISTWFIFLALTWALATFVFSMGYASKILLLSLPGGLFFASLIVLTEILTMKTPIAYGVSLAYAIFWLNATLQRNVPENSLINLVNPFFYIFHRDSGSMWTSSKFGISGLGILIISLSLLWVGKRLENLTL